MENRRGSRLSGWWLAATLVVVAPAASAEEVRARCEASAAGARVLVDVELVALFDPELVRLVRLGQAGQLTVEVELLRRRPFWFDAHVESARVRTVVTWSEQDKAFVIDGRRVTDLARLQLQRIALRARENPSEGHLVRVSVRLEVVTAESLKEVARWIGGEPEDDAASILAEQLVGTLVNDLAREARTGCEVRPLRALRSPAVGTTDPARPPR